MSENSKPTVYIPPNAKTNEDVVPMSPPEVYYEDRKVIFDKDAVKKVVKGKYGNDDTK